MKLFPEDPVFVVGEKGFDDKDADGQPFDVLGRKALGQKLTELVDRINQPMVIALDGGWGSGKSHFLKLWAGAHCLELGGKAEMIYFDAFEHDYLDDPLVSLVSRLTSEKAAKTWGAKAISTVKKAAFPLARLTTRLGLAAASYGGTEIAGALGDTMIGKLSDTADASIEQFWKAEAGRIAAMQGFRDALVGLTEAKADSAILKKIVFIVDELDRCRPDYALSLLEIIKHFFAVPNVHFVLGVNLKELENSVKARYGAEIGATKYLQKFVSLTMHLPKRSQGNPQLHFAKQYFEQMTPKFVQSAAFADACIKQLARPIEEQEVALRDVQRLLACFALFSARFDKLGWGYQIFLIDAAYLKVLHPLVFERLRAERVSIGEIEKCLSLQKPQREEDSGQQHMGWAVWAFALGGLQALKVLPVQNFYVDQIPSSFKNYQGFAGNGFKWNTAQALLVEAFDLFTLPSP